MAKRTEESERKTKRRRETFITASQRRPGLKKRKLSFYTTGVFSWKSVNSDSATVVIYKW